MLLQRIVSFLLKNTLLRVIYGFHSQIGINAETSHFEFFIYSMYFSLDGSSFLCHITFQTILSYLYISSDTLSFFSIKVC